jgi:Fic family protein
MRESGSYIESLAGGERVRAFLPHPLPPENPSLGSNVLANPLLEEANLALGRLDAMATLLPQTWLFIYMYVRKEAVLSSQIEGTQSTLSDLLAAEIGHIPGALKDDVREVSSYVAALQHGVTRIRGGFPLCNRLIREMHEILLDSGRGEHATPGEFRKSQNWIGGTRPGNAAFVPPPPQRLKECLSQFESYMNTESPSMPTLVRIALLHVQFETIHPFLDGNGRLGRLLIPLFLVANGALSEPLLYLSHYFRQHRATYYRLLQEVRLSGNWEAWIEFFLRGVCQTAGGALHASQAVQLLFTSDQAALKALGRKGATALQAHVTLQNHPVCTVAHLSGTLGVSHVSAGKAIAVLESLGILRETTGRQRGRVFVYTTYLNILGDSFDGTWGDDLS